MTCISKFSGDVARASLFLCLSGWRERTESYHSHFATNAGRDWKVWEGGGYTVLGFLVVEESQVTWRIERYRANTPQKSAENLETMVGRRCWLHWRFSSVGDKTEVGLQSILFCFAICYWRYCSGILLWGVYWRLGFSDWE